MSLNYLFSKTDPLSVPALIDQILQEFSPKQGQLRLEQPAYPLKVLLILFKHTGSFHPLLLKKLAKTFNLDKTKQEVYITRKQLLDQIMNPETRNFSKKDSEDIYDFLRGQNDQVQISQIVKRESLNNEKILKKSLSKEDVFKILDQHIFS